MATISRVATSDGIEWHCERQGSGLDLILIPSGEGDCANFARVAHLLAEHFAVTTFDMPGMSRSYALEPALMNLTASRLASQIAGLLDEISIPRATFYGCSSGGLIALALAAEPPHRVRNVIVHEVPLFCNQSQLVEMDDAQIVNACRHIFANELVEDKDACLALGHNYHARLDQNYITWVRRYMNQVERGFSRDELKTVPVEWTVGAKYPMGFYFSNVVTACDAGLPISLLPCRHFPQVTITDVLAKHIRRVGSRHL